MRVNELGLKHRFARALEDYQSNGPRMQFELFISSDYCRKYYAELWELFPEALAAYEDELTKE